ncbi:phytanoyl-CoA dioxygenase family protein [Curvivirga sp.]|uniref:phytanoyl-CoA dioxygenase family protein n=1 Tax=Curvivirga sp. TaxID=2856848 RepID=UPI003B59DB08
MIQKTLRQITKEEHATYDRDGVALLKQVFDQEWIAILNKGLDDSMNKPTHRARDWNRDSEGRRTFYDSQAWQEIPEYKQFVFESPCADLARQMMGSEHVNFFFDAVFCREAGVQFRTPWHQDEPYWSVEGFDTCSIWMPLTPVAAKSALSVVPGSHRWEKVYSQADFGQFNEGNVEDVSHSNFDEFGFPPLPDIDGEPDKYKPVSFDMVPGDCLFFNARCIHGGSGQLDEGKDLRVFNTKWCGDDVRVSFKPWGMDPDHTEVMTNMGLKDGDRLGTDLYPQII